MENPIKMDDLGVTTIYGNTHIDNYSLCGDNVPIIVVLSQKIKHMLSVKGSQFIPAWNVVEVPMNLTQ